MRVQRSLKVCIACHRKACSDCPGANCPYSQVVLYESLIDDGMTICCPITNEMWFARSGGKSYFLDADEEPASDCPYVAEHIIFSHNPLEDDLKDDAPT